MPELAESTITSLIDKPLQRDTAAPLYTPLMQSLIDLRAIVTTENWTQVIARADQALALSHSAFVAIRQSIDASKERFVTTAEFAREFDKLLESIATSEHRIELADQIIAEFEAEDGDIDESIFKALDAVKDGQFPGNVFADLTDTSISETPAFYARVIDAAIALYVRAWLTRLHAEFELSLIKIAPSIDGMTNIDIADEMGGIVMARAEALERAQMDVQALVRSNSDGLDSKIISICNDLTVEMLALARVQALGRHAATKLMDQQKGGEAERVGRAMVRAQTVLRETIATLASFLSLALHHGYTHRDPDIDALLGAARNTELGSGIPDARDVEIHQLDNHHDGDLVEVRGFVTGHRAFREGGPTGKLVSIATIMDPSSGASVEVATVFTHLFNSGMTRGAYVAASGTYKSTSTLLDGNAGVEITRLALSQLQHKHWKIALVRAARRWFQAYRNNHNAVWSLGPHVIVADGDKPDSEHSHLGAGELLFTPFIRDIR